MRTRRRAADVLHQTSRHQATYTRNKYQYQSDVGPHTCGFVPKQEWQQQRLMLPKKKKKVSTFLCFPKAYSLIIRQLGLNSGLRKCNTNKQISDSTELAIINLASVIIV